jgi:hypothetical protein
MEKEKTIPPATNSSWGVALVSEPQYDIVAGLLRGLHLDIGNNSLKRGFVIPLKKDPDILSLFSPVSKFFEAALVGLEYIGTVTDGRFRFMSDVYVGDIHNGSPVLLFMVYIIRSICK